MYNVKRTINMFDLFNHDAPPPIERERGGWGAAAAVVVVAAVRCFGKRAL